MVEITVYSCPCLPFFTNPIGHYCNMDKKIHLGELCNEEIVDIFINHETVQLAIAKMAGWLIGKKFDKLFKYIPEVATRFEILKAMDESGVPI